MQIIKKCDKAAYIIFMAAVLIHLLVMCGEFGVWEVPFRGRLLQVAFALCVIKILMTFYSYIEWMMLVGAAAVSALSYVFTREKYALYVAVLIFAAKSVDMKMVLKLVLDATILSTVIVVIASVAGMGGIVSETRDFGRGIVETRYSLGFSHANNLHGTYWYILSLMVLLYKDKAGWKTYSVMAASNILMFVLTKSKAGFAVAMLVIVAGAMYRYVSKYVFDRLYPYILGLLALAGVVGLTLVSVTADYYAGYGPVLKKLDSITTGRFNLAYQSAYIGDWKLFRAGGNHKYPVDNGFASLAADYGIVLWLVYLALIVTLIVICAKKKKGILFSIIISCVFYTFMESSFVLNDAYLLSNFIFIASMWILGEKQPPVVEEI